MSKRKDDGWDQGCTPKGEHGGDIGKTAPPGGGPQAEKGDQRREPAVHSRKTRRSNRRQLTAACPGNDPHDEHIALNEWPLLGAATRSLQRRDETPANCHRHLQAFTLDHVPLKDRYRADLAARTPGIAPDEAFAPCSVCRTSDAHGENVRASGSF
jgi:hypothetical protein